MKEILLASGLSYTGSCHCDGTFTQKYVKEDYEFRVKEKQGVFKVKRNGRSMTQWIPQSKLNETISQYFQEAV